jgi:UDP-glucose 4-epimerase
MNKFKKILLTGSSGTIGTRLFEKLLERGYNVTGFDKKENIYSPTLNKFTIIGDLLKSKDIKKIKGNFDLVIHFAANARVYKLVINPALAMENIVSTYNILEFSRKNNIKKFIFSSSREVYGNREEIVSREKDLDIHLCESPYSASKISDEALIYSFSKCYGINYIIFRFSNVYGMYDQSDRFVPLMIRKMRENKDIYIFGKDKVLDFTYIDDCVAGVIRGIEKFSKVKNRTLNLATGKGCNLLEVAEIIKLYLGSNSRINIGDNRIGEVARYIADISKIKKELSYKPKYSIKKGIESSLNWYLKDKNFEER